jgi:hypothetical protein
LAFPTRPAVFLSAVAYAPLLICNFGKKALVQLLPNQHNSASSVRVYEGKAQMIDAVAQDQLVEGSRAAEKGEPFSQFTSTQWQRGFTDRKRVQVAADLGLEHYQATLPILEALAAICRVLHHKGESAADLAQAVAFRALAGENISLELAFDPHAASRLRVDHDADCGIRARGICDCGQWHGSPRAAA